MEKERMALDKGRMDLVLERFPQMCLDAVSLAKDVKIVEEVESIVIAGMGGSGIAGDILKHYLSDLDIPIYIIKDYIIPKYVDDKSLVFVLSYSGNTEETIAFYKEAVKKSTKVISLCSGGKLEELCIINRTTCVKIPQGIQPRLSTLYLFFPMLIILQNSGLVENQLGYIKKTILALRKSFFRERAKDLAEKIGNKIPIIYASTKFMPVAMKWKTDINENAKVHAFYNIYPEFNHNEINAYVNKNGEFYIVIIKDEDDLRRIRKRMDITKKLIKDKGYDITEMVIKGDCLLSKMFSAILLGTWVSYWLALLYHTDPTPVDIVEDLKKELKD